MTTNAISFVEGVIQSKKEITISVDMSVKI